MNIMSHAYGDMPYEPYTGTVECTKAASEIFSVRPELHYGNKGEAKIAHAYAVVFSPFFACDLPCELIFDTLTFPYDVIPKDRYFQLID